MKLTIFVVTTILRLTPATPARTIQMMMMMLSGDVQNASRRGPFSLFVSAVCGVLCLCQYMICDVEILSSLLVLSSDITERAANIDHFDIVERVEMGQMASMFFNKGKSSCIIM